MTVAEIKAVCCKLGNDCAAFSWSADQDPAKPGEACAKKNMGGGVSHSSQFNGYQKNHFGGCDASSFKATAYVRYKQSAVVALASWCPSPANVTLTFDWDALGLAADSVSVTTPDIPGVQTYRDLGDGRDVRVTVLPSNNGGAILVLKPTKRD